MKKLIIPNWIESRKKNIFPERKLEPNRYILLNQNKIETKKAMIAGLRFILFFVSHDQRPGLATLKPLFLQEYFEQLNRTVFPFGTIKSMQIDRQTQHNAFRHIFILEIYNQNDRTINHSQ